MLVQGPAGAPRGAASEWPTAVGAMEAAKFRFEASVGRGGKAALEYLPQWEA